VTFRQTDGPAVSAAKASISIAGLGCLPPRSPSQKAVGAVLSDKAGKHLDRIRHETGTAADVISRAASCRQFHKTSDVFRSDLLPQRCP
jgi:hypothetical protein